MRKKEKRRRKITRDNNGKEKKGIRERKKTE